MVMAYHVMVTDLTGNCRIVACFVSIEAAMCCKTSRQAEARSDELYWVQSTTCCTCNRR